MGKNKKQPYQILGPKWQAVPPEKKLWYKERANNGGFGVGPPPRPQQTQPPSPPPPQPSQSEEKPKPTAGDFSFTQTKADPIASDLKPNRMTTPNDDVKVNIDIKPVIKEERGIKRELDVDVIHQREREHEQPNKKTKNLQGFGIPNWCNIKNSTQPDADRYFDYNLFKLREQCESIVQTCGRSLLTRPLCSFSCNVLCKYKDDKKEVKYIPLEIGIFTYSIKDGKLKEPYHVMIDSGPPPRNYWGDTYDHITATHKIQVTQTGAYPPTARKDYKAIYKEMLKYVRDGERTILVADNYDLEQVKKSIEWIYEMAAREDPNIAKPSTWTILPLVDFIAAMYNFVHVHMLHYPLPKFTLHYYLKVRLETSIWDYDLNLMCPYHRNDEYQTKWCARSCSMRVMNALQLTFEEIYKNYRTAEEAKVKSQQQADSQADVQADQPTSQSSTPSQKRVPAQQMQQPLNMPEEQEEPPIFEEMARREEMRRRQEEAFKNPPPPPDQDHEYPAAITMPPQN